MEKLADAIEENSQYKELAIKITQASDFEVQSFWQRARISAIATGESFIKSFFKEFGKSFSRWKAEENVDKQQLYDAVQKYRKDFYEADGKPKSLEEINKVEEKFSARPKGKSVKTNEKILAVFKEMKAEATKLKEQENQKAAKQQQQLSMLPKEGKSVRAPSVPGGFGGVLPPAISAEAYWKEQKTEDGGFERTYRGHGTLMPVHIYDREGRLCVIASYKKTYNKDCQLSREYVEVGNESGSSTKKMSFAELARMLRMTSQDRSESSIKDIVSDFLRQEGSKIPKEKLLKILSGAIQEPLIDPSLLAGLLEEYNMFDQQETASLVTYLNRQSIKYNQEFWGYFDYSKNPLLKELGYLMGYISDKKYKQNVSFFQKIEEEVRVQWEQAITQLLKDRNFASLLRSSDSTLRTVFQALYSQNSDTFDIITDKNQVLLQ